MPTYKAKAIATASVTAQFFFRKEEVVTASGSATAESNISQEDAYNTALSIAKEVAQSAAQNDANVLIQSVNTSVNSDEKNIYLDSSLLNGYIIQVSANEYDLVKDFSSTKYILNIEKGEILNINKGVTLSCSFYNSGTVNNYGEYISPGYTQKNTKNNKSTTSSTTSSTTTFGGYWNNSSTYTLGESDIFINEGTYTNYGIFDNFGTFDNYSEYIQASGGYTYNYNLIQNYYNVVYNGITYFGTIQINGGYFYNSTNNSSIYLIYSTGVIIPSETYFFINSGGVVFCQDPNTTTPPVGYYSVDWSYTTTPTNENETVYGPIYSNSYSSGYSYALVAQQTDPGIITYYKN